MGWTKRQFVVQAFEEIGYANYDYDLQTEQLQSALRRLDAMMATWNGRTIRLGYPLPSSPQDSELSEKTNVPDIANEAVYLNLALRIAPTVGKSVSPETKVAARDAYKELLKRAAMPNEMQYPDTLPTGQGNKSWRYRDNPFTRPSRDPVDAGADGEIDFY